MGIGTIVTAQASPTAIPDFLVNAGASVVLGGLCVHMAIFVIPKILKDFRDECALMRAEHQKEREAWSKVMTDANSAHSAQVSELFNKVTSK